MSSELQYDNDQYDYSTDSRSEYAGSRSKPRNAVSNAPRRGRKRGKAPTSVNGMHRRRRRKMAW